MALKIDLIRDSGVTEQFGRIIEIKRIAHVSGLTGDSSTLIDALSEAGLPVANAVHPDHTSLRLLRREVKSIEGFGKECFVELTYGYVGVVTNGVSAFTLSGGTGVEQVESIRDRTGTQITLTDPNGNTQVGKISVPSAQSTLRFTRTEQTNTPGVISKTYVNKVNSANWMGGNPKEWWCSNIHFELIAENTTPDTYRMTYEFQFKEGGWDPLVWFIDPNTGQAPPGLTAAGIKTVDWFVPVNFSTLFPGT